MIAVDSTVRDWLALSLALGPASSHLRPLLAALKSPAAVLSADEAALTAADKTLRPGALTVLTHAARLYEEADRILAECADKNVRVICPGDVEFSPALSDLAKPPAVLFLTGQPLSRAMPAMGIVGTRAPDAYGIRQTYTLSFVLAASGMPVVSGLARGVDGMAAVGALEAGGTTVGVLGCGIEVVYPRRHETLYAAVAEKGTLVSEYVPGTPPNAWQFPERNRLIAALSDGLAVMEAGVHSGALITARYAQAGDKPVFALPGDVDAARSAGCNRLLRHGARVLLDPRDVLAHFWRELPGLPYQRVEMPGEPDDATLERYGLSPLSDRVAPAVSEKPRNGAGKPQAEQAEEEPDADSAAALLAAFSEAERAFYRALPDEPFTVDVLIAAGMPVADAFAGVTELELEGLLTAGPGGTYVKKYSV